MVNVNELGNQGWFKKSALLEDTYNYLHASVSKLKYCKALLK